MNGNGSRVPESNLTETGLLLLSQADAAHARARWHFEEVDRLDRSPIAGYSLAQITILRAVNALRGASELQVADALRRAAAAFVAKGESP